MFFKKMKEAFLKYPTRTISFSFVCVIFAGSLLLCLPVANSGPEAAYLDHLFVAVSATCVTGLVPHTVANQYTLFGQLVILLMIQIGGLGFLTFLMLFFVFMKRRLSFSSRLLIQEALNKSTLDNLPHFISQIFGYTLFCEGAGAVLLGLAFIPRYGLVKGLYYSVFHSVSAFCNAGFDVLGASSLADYISSPLVCLTIAALIIAGGLGFVVALEIKQRVISYLNSKDSFKKFLRSFSLQAKMVIVISVILIISGTLLVYIFEKNNPDTIGHLSFGKKMLASFFQSVTYRTAGFSIFDQGALNDISKLLACVLMFIGGSPAGTAGGIKTITVGVLYLCVRSVVKGSHDVVAFSRRISEEVIRRTLAVVSISVVIVFMACLLLCLVEPFDMIDIFYECFSAFATVGLTANLTPLLSDFSKVIIIILMFIGRVGPISMALTFVRRGRNNIENEIVYPEGEILVG